LESEKNVKNTQKNRKRCIVHSCIDTTPSVFVFFCHAMILSSNTTEKFGSPQVPAPSTAFLTSPQKISLSFSAADHPDLSAYNKQSNSPARSDLLPDTCFEILR
jgi:hypothetical protein